jgi:hypothetical protein
MRSKFNVMRQYGLACRGIAGVVDHRNDLASHAARRLEAERSFGCDVLYAPVLRAGVLSGQAAAEASDAAAAALARHYPMHAEAARLRAAECRGDQAARQKELDALAARGVKRPEAFVNVLAPRPAP